MQVARLVDPHRHAARPAGQHVPTAAPIGVDEVEVIPGHLDALRVAGKAEADDRALDVVEVEDVLLVGDLGERRVRRLVSGHRARVH